MRPLQLLGKTFGRLTIISALPPKKRGSYWLCKCDCGNIAEAQGAMLTFGHTKSCGCLSRDSAAERHRTHGLRFTSTWEIWRGMKSRCFNPKNLRYKDYGGRGITVCDKWLTFEGFFADMGERPADRSLDRIDNDGPYSPENCRWATKWEQARNKTRRAA